jgi:hypothetical protein
MTFGTELAPTMKQNRGTTIVAYSHSPSHHTDAETAFQCSVFELRLAEKRFCRWLSRIKTIALTSRARRCTDATRIPGFRRTKTSVSRGASSRTMARASSGSYPVRRAFSRTVSRRTQSTRCTSAPLRPRVSSRQLPHGSTMLLRLGSLVSSSCQSPSTGVHGVTTHAHV